MNETIIKSILESIVTGSQVDAELVALPEGKTLDEVMAERGLKPHGERCSCGNQHEWISEDGKRVLAFANDHEKETKVSESDNDAFNEKRAKAIEGILRRQAIALEIYDLLKDMEKSISLDFDKRDPEDLLKEITTYAEIQRLARKL